MFEGLAEARKVLELAYKEVEVFHRDGELLRLRNACEKGWLAIILATDALLTRYGFKKPESYKERREFLRELERRYHEVAELGLRDRFGARGYYLHILGYHEGALSEDEVVEELKKVEKYISDVEKLLRRCSISKNSVL